MWGDVGRESASRPRDMGEIWGDLGRSTRTPASRARGRGEMWGDVGRESASRPRDMGEIRGDVGRCGEMWGESPLLGEPELDLEHRKVA